MSKPSETASRGLLVAAKRAQSLALDVRSALIPFEGEPWAAALVLQCRRLASDCEERAVDLGRASREEDRPLIAAIEARACEPIREPVIPATHPSPANGSDCVAAQSGAIPAQSPALASDPPGMKPKKRSKARGPSWDVLVDGREDEYDGGWIARVWAETAGEAWGLANGAFPSLGEKFRVEKARARFSQCVIHAGGERLVRTDYGACRMATAGVIERATPEAPGREESTPVEPPLPEVLAGDDQAEDLDDSPAFVCNRCNHSRPPHAGHPCPECKCPEFRLRNIGPGELTDYERKLAIVEDLGPPLQTYEVIEKPGQEAPGHIQFRAPDLVEAIEHARVDWPGMHVRPVAPGKELAVQKGSDGRPKTLPETLTAGRRGRGRPPVDPDAGPVAWRVWDDGRGVELDPVTSASEGGARKKARRAHPGLRHLRVEPMAAAGA